MAKKKEDVAIVESETPIDKIVLRYNTVLRLKGIKLEELSEKSISDTVSINNDSKAYVMAFGKKTDPKRPAKLKTLLDRIKDADDRIVNDIISVMERKEDEAEAELKKKNEEEEAAKAKEGTEKKAPEEEVIEGAANQKPQTKEKKAVTPVNINEAFKPKEVKTEKTEKETEEEQRLEKEMLEKKRKNKNRGIFAVLGTALLLGLGFAWHKSNSK